MAFWLEISLGTSAAVHFSPTAAIIAGWTGRDIASVRSHIDELAAIGVASPSQMPLYYRVSSSLLTTERHIEVVGTRSSGEVEPVLLNIAGQIWLGLGSDHTDRELEAHSVALSKQACPKPIATAFWPLSDVADHLDRLALSAWTRDDAHGPWLPYQEGTLAGIKPLDALAAAAPLVANGWPISGAVMMCGTVPLRDGHVRPSRFFRMRLSDPVLGREIEHEYETISLPVIR